MQRESSERRALKSTPSGSQPQGELEIIDLTATELEIIDLTATEDVIAPLGELSIHQKLSVQKRTKEDDGNEGPEQKRTKLDDGYHQAADRDHNGSKQIRNRTTMQQTRKRKCHIPVLLLESLTYSSKIVSFPIFYMGPHCSDSPTNLDDLQFEPSAEGYSKKAKV